MVECYVRSRLPLACSVRYLKLPSINLRLEALAILLTLAGFCIKFIGFHAVTVRFPTAFRFRQPQVDSWR